MSSYHNENLLEDSVKRITHLLVNDELELSDELWKSSLEFLY